MSYTSITYKNPLAVNSINPISKLQNGVDKINNGIDTISYWINPKHWFMEIHKGLDWLVNQPEMAESLMAGTIIGIWFIMAGANWPKKWLFWSWIVYWVLRGIVYRN